jgi:hypothetical protein
MNNIINKSIIISSTPTIIWDILTDDKHIRQRCSPFAVWIYAQIQNREAWSIIERRIWDDTCTKWILTVCKADHKLVTSFYEIDDENWWYTEDLGETIESYEILDQWNHCTLNIIAWPFPDDDWQKRWDKMNIMRDQALEIIKDLSKK